MSPRSCDLRAVACPETQSVSRGSFLLRSAFNFSSTPILYQRVSDEDVRRHAAIVSIAQQAPRSPSALAEQARDGSRSPAD